MVRGKGIGGCRISRTLDFEINK